MKGWFNKFIQMKEHIQPHGLIIPKIETHEEGVNHVLGAAGPGGILGAEVNPSGNWMPWLPEKEPQSKNGVETFACGIWGTLNSIEEAIYFATGIRVNYSDRALANIAKKYGILDPKVGSDPHRVAELVRKISGLLREERCPWTDDIKTADDFYGILEQELTELIKEGQPWYNDWELNHKWVFNSWDSPEVKRQKIEQALRTGPVSGSVYAWVEGDKFYIKPKGAIDNHWTNIPRAESGQPYKCFDSYDNYIKDLDPLYDFAIAKVYYLTPAKPKLDWIQGVIDWIKSLIPFLKKQVDEVAPIPIDADPPPPAQPVERPKVPKVNKWAEGVKIAEGFHINSRSWRNKNPGNLKTTELTKSLGSASISVGGFIGQDKDDFAIFDTYESGFRALCQFLTLAAEDRLRPYHDTRTLKKFSNKYAGNPPPSYARTIARHLGVSEDIDISQLI